MKLLDKLKGLLALNRAANNIQEAYKMNSTIKPGWKTTEFWMAVATNVIAVVGTLKGVIPPDHASLIIAIANAVYGIARAITKASDSSATPTPSV